MLTSEDIRRVTFDKTMRGYRCDDVDDYLKQVADAMDALNASNDELQKKLVVLAQRIEQYRAEEDTLRTTMINAQRLGDNVIKEAKQKAAEIIQSAAVKAGEEQQRARSEVELAKQEVVTLKSEADSFKKSLLTLYREHIQLISRMPEYSSATDTMRAPAQPEPEPEPAPVSYQPESYHAAAEPEEETPHEVVEFTEEDIVDAVEPEEIIPDEPVPEKPRKRSGRKQKNPAEAGKEVSALFDNFDSVDFES